MKKYSFVLGLILGLIFLLACFNLFLLVSKEKREETVILKGFKSLVDERHLLPSITPTLALPTPTPTLNPTQLAEIREKRFTELNKKFGPCRYVPILMYHHVLDSTKAKAILASNLNVPPEIFRQQMDFLMGKGYQVIGLDEMVGGLQNNSLPAQPVVLTFDDGYKDFYENVFPILQEKNFKATVFIITQFVSGERYLNWSQIKELSNSGLILIGDHTLNHPYVPNLSKDEEWNQIVSAKKILEEKLGKNVEFFAYPYGSANQTAKEILKEAGFGGAVITTNTYPQCVGLPYELSRLRIGASSLARYGL